MFQRLLLACLLLMPLQLFANGAAEFCGKEAKPCLKYGAYVFQARCSLCHGSDGLGEGVLPLSIPDYPATNLLDPKFGKKDTSVSNIVIHGTGHVGGNEWMPPWGDELTYTQLQSVVEFVVYMRNDLEGALKILRKQSENIKPSFKVGRAIYHGRCALCHGSEGKGDGKMARIIKEPPPFNLTYSMANDDYLHDIISKGGSGVGRSPRMPPWGGDLTEPEIQSVIMYIKTFRQK